MAWGPPIMPPCCEMASHEIDGVCVLRQGYDVVLYGDSITENWRGTSAGELWKWSNGTLDSRFVGGDMKSVFLTAFQKYRTGVMAVAGVLHAPHSSRFLVKCSTVHEEKPTLRLQYPT